MSEGVVPGRWVLCAVPDGKGRLHRRRLVVVGLATVASSPTKRWSDRTVLRWILATCPKHGVVAVREAEALEAFKRGRQVVNASKRVPPQVFRVPRSH